MNSLDVKGLSCPLPILRTSRRLQNLKLGDVLYIEATDPKTLKDFIALCNATHHELLSYREEHNVFYFCIKKNSHN